MRNFLFISPNYPTTYWLFCRELKNNGLRVLGIGDQPWHELAWELRNCLEEYCQVSSLENYDEVYRTTAYLISKYGRIDWVESNNEYWLELDAKLRTDFHITSGWQTDDLARIRYKSGMKEYYQRAGIPTARYCMADDSKHRAAFLRRVGYPVIAKPDNGVGATHTYKIHDAKELRRFLAERDRSVSFIMEEFITAQINSYDAIIDADGEPVFETGNVTPVSIMDLVNEGDNVFFYIVRELAEDVRAAGRAAVRSFGVKSRFVHFEFFRLQGDQHIGKDGEVVALEVNMRPSGGYSPDMMNFANSTDVYKIWADMIAFGASEKPVGEQNYCAYIGRRDGRPFALSDDELTEEYADEMRMVTRNPGALAEAMGDRVFIAVFPTEEEMLAFSRDALRYQEEPEEEDEEDTE